MCIRDRIYGIPLKANRVLCIDPPTATVTTVDAADGGGLGDGFEKWEGGVQLEGAGAMYCMPLNAKHVLKIEASSHRDP